MSTKWYITRLSAIQEEPDEVDSKSDSYLESVMSSMSVEPSAQHMHHEHQKKVKNSNSSSSSSSSSPSVSFSSHLWYISCLSSSSTQTPIKEPLPSQQQQQQQTLPISVKPIYPSTCSDYPPPTFLLDDNDNTYNIDYDDDDTNSEAWMTKEFEEDRAEEAMAAQEAQHRYMRQLMKARNKIWKKKTKTKE